MVVKYGVTSNKDKGTQFSFKSRILFYLPLHAFKVRMPRPNTGASELLPGLKLSFHVCDQK